MRNLVHKLTLILVVIKMTLIENIMVVLDKNKNYCVNKDLTPNEILKASFSVSGEQEEVVKIVLVGPYDKKYYENIYNNTLLSNGHFQITTDNEGNLD